MVTLPSLRDVPVENWKALAGKRLFLGHQSVGGNILEGISDLMHEHPEIRLSIVEGTRSELFDRPVLAHSTVGRNGDPLSKMRDFQRMMDQGLGGRVDLAFFKFCYLDFDSRSDVESIFSTYLEIMTGLQERYPGTRFLHATAPLRSMPVSGIERIKHLVKRLLGKPGVVQDNEKRQRFNDLLKRRFPTEQIFDLALAETVASDGTLEVAGSNPNRVMMLRPAFTYDGGHLNELGRQRVAEQLLITLARAKSWR